MAESYPLELVLNKANAELGCKELLIVKAAIQAYMESDEISKDDGQHTCGYSQCCISQFLKTIQELIEVRT